MTISRTTAPILGLFVLSWMHFHAVSKYGNKNLNFWKFWPKQNFWPVIWHLTSIWRRLRCIVLLQQTYQMKPLKHWICSSDIPQYQPQPGFRWSVDCDSSCAAIFCPILSWHLMHFTCHSIKRHACINLITWCYTNWKSAYTLLMFLLFHSISPPRNFWIPLAYVTVTRTAVADMWAISPPGLYTQTISLRCTR